MKGLSVMGRQSQLLLRHQRPYIGGYLSLRLCFPLTVEPWDVAP